MTLLPDYRSGDLAEGRRAVLKDLKRYRRVPYKNLVHSLFGTPEDGKILEIRRKLKASGLITQDDKRWSNFTVKLSAMQSTEPAAFRLLGPIISKVFEQAPNFQFEFVAELTTTSTRGNTSRPDAYIKSSGKEPHWFNIAIPFEFKKSDTDHDRQDNEHKMVWSLHNIMREDPLRRFAMGITIENTRMRIWHNSRALLSVSESIDFTTEIDSVTGLFYLIAQQMPVGLGWDSTVKRSHVGKNEFQYVFRIGGQEFATIGELATYGADAMVGRGSRVYKARDKDDKIVAIKDSWRDLDRDHEGLILENICTDIRNKFGQAEETKARKFFVAIRLYEDVVIYNQRDETLVPGEDGQWISIDDAPVLSSRRHLSSTGHVPNSDHLSSELLQPPLRARMGEDEKVPRRVHARTVFDDVGEPLMNLSRMVDSFTCLSHAREALEYVHKADWVHRDFSVTNVLWVELESGDFQGKLTDFEYAKKVNSDRSHDVRTGTMHFMAVEVANQCYLFFPECSRAAPPPFRMNFLHDLESHWWAATWILLYHTDTNLPTQDPDLQLVQFNKAFPLTLDATARLNFFRFTNMREATRKTLSYTYRDQCEAVIHLADDLKYCYWEAEKPFPKLSLSDELLNTAHKVADEAFSKVLGCLDDKIRLQPLYKVKKRGADDLSTQQLAKRARRHDITTD